MRKAKPIMIQGTMSNAGKSLLCAALCRIFRQDGYRVAPFKSQNMALNSFITDEGLEMGRAQVVQAEAAGVKPSVLMNPILLKPTTDVGSQVIVNGEVRGNMRAADYFRYKTQLIPDILRAYDTLAAENDIMVIEGAGSPAEINLKSADIVNMGMAKMAESPVLLVGDIDRGGVFAQLYGTVALLEPNERAMVKATVINKFRGDVSILAPGLDMLYDLVKVPCAGVVPYVHVDIDDEDSLSERLTAGERKEIDIAVISLPRISNFTDFSPFSRFSAVSLRYVKNLFELGSPDLIILPGTKSTIADLKWMRQNGLEAGILKAASRGTPVFGICGGLQMLGTKIADPYETEGGGEIAGMGLLPAETVFAREKTRTQTEGIFRGLTGLWAPLNGLYYRGYEIHMGQSGFDAPVLQSGNVCGSYIHGLFDENGIAEAVVRMLYDRAGLKFDGSAVFDVHVWREAQYDKLADTVRGALDMKLIYRILEEGI
ncbi:MAG: cobyric acid synthase [Clostridiales bacterium]|nr:cobyric acid synthase [Clostridiales bacterium]